MPLPTTITIVDSACSADPSISPPHKKKILDAVREFCPSEIPASNAPRLMRRREVAKLLGVTPRTIDNLAMDGTLPRVRLPGRSRGVGFRLRDVEALIERG